MPGWIVIVPHDAVLGDDFRAGNGPKPPAAWEASYGEPHRTISHHSPADSHEKPAYAEIILNFGPNDRL
jgi:hypothetical protein